VVWCEVNGGKYELIDQLVRVILGKD